MRQQQVLGVAQGWAREGLEEEHEGVGVRGSLSRGQVRLEPGEVLSLGVHLAPQQCFPIPSFVSAYPSHTSRHQAGAQRIPVAPLA